MSIKSPSIFQQGFSKNITSHYLSFLNLADKKKTSVICKMWNITFNNVDDERFWLNECLKQNLSPDSIGAVAYGLETVVGKYFSEEGIKPSKSRRCWKIVKLIAEYAPDCMHREKALIISGRVEFYRDNWECKVYPKGDESGVQRWGMDEHEATVMVSYMPDTDESASNWSLRKFFFQNNIISLENMSDTLIDEWIAFDKPKRIPNPAPLLRLPWHVPLSFFLDKEEGDSIRVSIKGRKIVLLCYHKHEVCPIIPPVEIHSFREALDQRIQISLFNDTICPYYIDQARDLAKARPHWISPD